MMHAMAYVYANNRTRTYISCDNEYAWQYITHMATGTSIYNHWNSSLLLLNLINPSKDKLRIIKM